MEFTKNYSDDLLMDQTDGKMSGGADLADFELPPCSGSSSGSEPPTKIQPPPIPTSIPTQSERSSLSSSPPQAPSSSQVSAAPPDLAAVKNLLVSSYSKVSYIFYWKKPIETGVVFSIGASLILAFTFFSSISVVAYTALGVILTSATIRLYKGIMKTLNKSPATPLDNVWDKVLSLDVSMSPERMHQVVESSHVNLNASLLYFKQVLLVQDKLATFKFGAFLYALTYIGSWFNGLTLITICYLALFSVPIFYENNKTKVDEYFNLATKQLSSVIGLVTSKVTALTSGGSGSKKQE